jgi:hypothetical protein
MEKSLPKNQAPQGTAFGQAPDVLSEVIIA